MNRNILAWPLVAAALAAGPALAQTATETPFASRNMPGSGTEQRDDNVWEGAINSSRPALPSGELYTGRSAVMGPPPLAEDVPLGALPEDDGADVGVGIGLDADEGGIGVGAGVDLD